VRQAEGSGVNWVKQGEEVLVRKNQALDRCQKVSRQDIGGGKDNCGLNHIKHSVSWRSKYKRLVTFADQNSPAIKQTAGLSLEKVVKVIGYRIYSISSRAKIESLKSVAFRESFGSVYMFLFLVSEA